MKITNFQCTQCGGESLVAVFENQTKYKYNPKRFIYKKIKFKWHGIKSQCLNCKKIYYIKKDKKGNFLEYT